MSTDYPDPMNVPWTAADRREVEPPRCALTRKEYDRRMRRLVEEYGQVWVHELLEFAEDFGEY